MAVGHRVFAARSVLDGREHDGSLDAEGGDTDLPSSTALALLGEPGGRFTK